MCRARPVAHAPVTDVAPEGAENIIVQYRTLRHQFFSDLHSPAAQCTVIRPTFDELKSSGAFVELPDILEKTLQFCSQTLARFQNDPKVDTAMALRQAAVLSLTAGDGMANVR